MKDYGRANWLMILRWHSMGSWGWFTEVSTYFIGDDCRKRKDGLEGTEYFQGYSTREIVSRARKYFHLERRLVRIQDERYM